MINMSDKGTMIKGPMSQVLGCYVPDMLRSQGPVFPGLFLEVHIKRVFV